LQVVNGVIEIRPIKRGLREGWETDSARVAEQENEALVWPEFANTDDSALQW
jgi:antitoxin MazE